MRRLYIMAAALFWVHPLLAAHTTARLLLSHEAARPGETVWAGLQLSMDPGWSTYWRNSGESGLPTTVAWKLPEGVSAGEMLWPTPEKYRSSGQTTYVYHGQVILFVPLRLAEDVQAGTLDLQAELRWLECEKICVKGQATVAGKLTIGAETKPSSEASRLEAGRAKLPVVKPAEFVRAWWEGPAKGVKRTLVIEWTAQKPGAKGDFYPFPSQEFDLEPETESVTAGVGSGAIRLRKTVHTFGGSWPAQLMGLAVEQSSGVTSGAFEVAATIAATASPVASAASAAAAATGGEGEREQAAAGEAGQPELAAGDETPAVPEPTRMSALWLNLGLAFVGGFILNLMPCVLPVIALKILGFVNQSHGSPAQARRLGILYGLGVLVSMLVLAGFVIAVKGTGKIASWGMQFQNPFFVVAITTLVLLVALNLFGVFEVSLGDATMGRAGALAAKEGGAGAFFNGVLAVVLATPCTAPFLGVALGFAFAQPPGIIILMFASVALGLALPYVLLSAYPRLLKFMPKPGAWMEHFKIAMGFPMVATVLWLLTISAVHYGVDGVFWIGIFLVMVALGAWIWGQFVQRGRVRRSFAAVLALVFIVGGYAVALESQLHWRAPGGKIAWQPWSADAVAAARKEGRPILVDFTAVWCAICQANKKTSIEIASVRQRLKEINAVTLIGDFSAEDEVIALELQKFGRAGVPLVLVYPKDASKPPIVLPELLTAGTVLDALEKAGQ